MVNCKGITKKGELCMRISKHASGFCSLHQPKSPKKSTVQESRPSSESYEWEMGDLSDHFPPEIMREILLNLNIFDLSRFSRVNRCCQKVVKDFKLIDGVEVKLFQSFVKSFKNKPTIVGYDIAKKYRIPHPRQHLILYPKEILRLTYIDSRIQARSKIKYRENKKGEVLFSIDKSHFEAFTRKFLCVPSTMTLDVLAGPSTIWNFQDIFLHYRKMKTRVDQYQEGNPNLKL